MAGKTRRFEMRTDEETDRLLADAAALVQMSKSAFALDAVRREALRVVGRGDVTLIDPAVFASLIDSLDEPDEVPNDVLDRFRRIPRRTT